MDNFDSPEGNGNSLDDCDFGSIPEWLLDLADDRGFRLGNEVRRSDDGTIAVRWFVLDRACNLSYPLDQAVVTPGQVRDYILEASGG